MWGEPQGGEAVSQVLCFAPRPETGPLRHPAGLVLPLTGADDLRLVGPGLRAEIASGDYCGRAIAQLTKALRSGDRVLDLGAGIGLTSAVAARHPGVARVIALEPNPGLHGVMARVHGANGVARAVERVAALPGVGRLGRAPFYLRRDLRQSSLLAGDGRWERVVEVPYVDLNLILAEERITLIHADLPSGLDALLARADLAGVERLVLTVPTGAEALAEALARQGFRPRGPVGGAAMQFRR